MNALQQLITHGQSYWLDNLTRHMVESGELKERVQKQGLRGVTSNPAIFEKAISKGSDYDHQIRQLTSQGADRDAIYHAVVVKDVQDACDILRETYDATDGEDGYVSLEVSPHLAHHAEATMKEARVLFAAVDRPNCFIKIPGTPAGVPAIEQMLYEGININITLLFSIENYEAVALTYLRALERRAEESKPLKSVASVASFFLSRIDVLVDRLLSHRIFEDEDGNRTEPDPRALMGKVAVANAKLAYQSFQKIFDGERWNKLARLGARVQRPLWASTSTKNPAYSDVRYVEPLIGPSTVNTLPEETIEAFAEHGRAEANTVLAGIEQARTILDDLGKTGINLDCVTRQLLDEGIQKFIDPYRKLLDTLEDKRLSFAIGEKQPSS